MAIAFQHLPAAHSEQPLLNGSERISQVSLRLLKLYSTTAEFQLKDYTVWQKNKPMAIVGRKGAKYFTR